MKKGQGLSLQVIIIALICLVILVILIAIVGGKMKVFGKKAADCTTKGGECMLETQCDETTDRFRQIERTNCEAEQKGNICCIKIY